MKIRRAICALCATVAALGTATAAAAPIKNGSFERGDFSGWEVREFGPGQWNLLCAIPRGFSFSVPPAGLCAAITAQDNPSVQVLSQVVRLREDRRHRLSYQMAWNNEAAAPRGPAPPPNGFITPNSLQLSQPNQQFRVDVMKPGAPIRSTDGDDVLMRIARPTPDDPPDSDWARTAANLTRFGGERIRLRFAVAVTEEELHLGVDAVKIKSRRKR